MSETKDGILEKLGVIVGSINVSAEPAMLESYSRDQSFTPPQKPNYVVMPKKVKEVQEIVRLANQQLMPVIPYSSGTDFHGAAVPNQGGILVDLSRMNKIVELDTLNWHVTIEPGITFAQLSQEVGKQGFRVLTPLLTPPSASVLSTYLEREPVPQAADFIYGNEQVQTIVVVLPNGEIFTPGNPAIKGSAHSSPHGPGLNFYRLLICAQGTLGIVYQMNLRLMLLPKAQKTLFFTFDNITDAVSAIKNIQRKELGLECFALNDFDLAVLLTEADATDTKKLKQGSYISNTGAKPWSEDQQQRFNAIREALPPWTVVISLFGWTRRPEEKVEYQELDLRDLAAEAGFTVKNTVGSVPALDKIMEEEFLLPWRMQKRFGYKGSCHGLMFHATGDSIQMIEDALCQVAARYRYSSSDIGAYIQPVERARTFYCVYDLHSNPTDADDVGRVKAFFNEASETLIDLGAFFDRPYGPWAEMVYRRNGAYSEYLKKLKRELDPNLIMNPGKLCF
ncbi:FAD-binding oxidoreductase [Chloroflexota bacterium]